MKISPTELQFYFEKLQQLISMLMGTKELP